MKQIVTTLIIFIITVSFAFGQKQQTNTINNQQNLINSLTKQVDQKWIRENPSLQPTKSSFFNSDNESKYFVGLLQISGHSIPFTWDNNLILLQFLLTLDDEIEIEQGAKADQNFKGTKISWSKNMSGLVWFNDKHYKATVDNWHLFGMTECPGTIIFPNLSFQRLTEIPNAITNNIQGLTIFPYNEKLIITRKETTIKTTTGKTIKGFAYDLDSDGVFDIFNYEEEIDETTNYTRLYLNVSGQWKCKWIHLEEVCL